ncbi:MAG: glycoside hydrolase family 127 protein [Clostridiales bacterium]|nr:glycoside hydrolase family 127 protein [Clostridiales bacterium]
MDKSENKIGKVFKPVPYREVRITGGFWKAWQDVAAERTVPAVYRQFEQTGRFFALTHEWREGDPHKPHIFYDSDAAKWIEGAAYSLFFRPDAETERRIEALIDLIEAGMSAEGYFNSYYQTIEPHARWTRRENHELYCAGHLIEAATAYYEATGKRRFLDLMRRFAEYIRRTFAVERSAKFETPGHEEIELALVRLWQCTGERQWLELALRFVERRGKNPEEHCFGWFSPSYAQDQAPVAEQGTAEGHVVRFGYLFTAVADLARETGDMALLAACRRVWRDVCDRKLYVTGGVGNMKHGEAFGPAYFLPNFEAYTETCASIALAFFARRLLTIDPRGEYADIAELEFYNGALAGISLDGVGFFYENPLSFRPSDQTFLNAHRASGRPVRRVEVFDCSCCPPNILRMIASIGEWAYGVSEGGGPGQGGGEPPVLLVHHYLESTARLTFAGHMLTLRQETRYPWDGKVSLTIRVDGAESTGENGASVGAEGASAESTGGGAASTITCTIGLRAPGWCESPKVNYETVQKDGYLYITREWRDGDVILLDLPMEVTELEANPYVSQDAGRVALRRGPIVYCVEGADNGERLEDLLIPTNAADAGYEAVWDDDLLGGAVALRFSAARRKPFSALYRKWQPEYEQTRVTAIPYYAWGNREEGEMTVWIRKA